MASEFVVSSGNTSRLLDLVTKSLYQFAVLVHMPVIRPWFEPVGPGRYGRFNVALGQISQQAVGVTALVGQKGWRFKPFNQCLPMGHIAATCPALGNRLVIRFFWASAAC